MKKCSRCRKKKPLDQFYKNRSGYRPECKECFREIMKPRSAKHYQDNKNYYQKRNRARTKAIAEFIRQEKTGKTCKDCGLPHPPWRMDFDHLPGRSKEIEVSLIARRGWSLDRVKKEIAKCDLVCANCHRDRTHERRQRS